MSQDIPVMLTKGDVKKISLQAAQDHVNRVAGRQPRKVRRGMAKRLAKKIIADARSSSSDKPRA